MSDELLPYYQAELQFLRDMGGQFALAHPKIAARLRLDANMAEDPHVSRMVEAFAYLAARTRHKLDDEFPEITEALLGVLYPHYLAPIPSAAIVQLELDPTSGDPTIAKQIRRHALVESPSIDGQPCRFRTAFDVTLWPIRVSQARLQGLPFQSPPSPFASQADAVIRLDLECASDRVQFKGLPLERLRFHLSGQSVRVHRIYELLLNQLLGIAVASPASSDRVMTLPKDAVQPAGFAQEDELLSYPNRSFVGYRLLSEYFAFPEKYHFFDLTGLTPEVLSLGDGRLSVYFFLEEHAQELENHVGPGTFRLGCTPIVNLFSHRAEPIPLDHNLVEYPVVPDVRRPRSYEVYSIDRVVAENSRGETAEVAPFYSLRHGSEGGQQPRGYPWYWQASRRAAGYRDGEVDHGTEVVLSIVDLDLRPSAASDWVLDVQTTCLNRDLPHRLPFGGSEPRLQLTEEGANVRVRCLTRPTRTLRPSLRKSVLWRLISHLSLNHLSLADNVSGAEPLREILRLYDFVERDEIKEAINGITHVSSRRAVARTIERGMPGFCRGLEVTVEFDEDRYPGRELFLFATVLERFLGLSCSINSFTQMVATTKRRQKVIRRWSPRAGERLLI
jgi:type VI secretion system protein ImpG